MLIYALGRVARNRAARDSILEIRDAIPQDRYKNKKSSVPIINYLSIPVRWAEYLTRKEDKTMNERERGETIDVDGILQGDGEAIVNSARSLAGAVSRLSHTQVRNFYASIIRLRESKDKFDDKMRTLHLLRPRLHYMAARDNKAKDIKDAYDRLIPKVKEQTQLGFLFDFSEALVAFHREANTR